MGAIRQPRQLLWLCLFAVPLLFAGGWALVASWPTPPPGKNPDPPAQEPASPPSPLSDSPYLHARPGTGYVGTKACVGCHPAEHQSYMRTQHAHSLAEVALDAEPPDGDYFHAPSGRAYHIARKEGRLWHREALRLQGGKELLLSEYPMRYAFGSGTHTRSYVVEDDGFLIESPATWYPSKKTWDMSPGYEAANHLAFERIASYRCFLCHVGQVEQVEQTPNRVKVHELAIGCERCHGPGKVHVKKHRSGEKFAGEDLTILRPDKLSRQLNEAICAQCHLGPVASVDVRGHGIGDFLPGLPLTDFRIDYAFTTPEEGMPVVGHFSQMRESRCYQRSEELTCTTCHRLHHKPSEALEVDYYRNRCLSCHQAPGTPCALPEKTRLQQNAQDSCIACHMPTTPTNVPHTAFTHHRIAIHDPRREPKKEPRPQGPGTLVPVLENSQLSEIERQRCLGLAYAQLPGDSKYGQGNDDSYARRAQKLLEGVRRRGLRDPQVDVALANLAWRREPGRAIALAESALRYRAITPVARRDALFILGTSYFDRAIPQRAPFSSLFVLGPDRFDRAALDRARGHLRQLVRARRDAEDWLLLGVCRHVAGDEPGAREAVRQAAAISPGNPEVQRILALLCDRAGLRDQADQHRERAAKLVERRQP